MGEGGDVGVREALFCAWATPISPSLPPPWNSKEAGMQRELGPDFHVSGQSPKNFLRKVNQESLHSFERFPRPRPRPFHFPALPTQPNLAPTCSCRGASNVIDRASARCLEAAAICRG